MITQLEAVDITDDPERLLARVTTPSEQARSSLTEARRAIAELGSPRLDEDDLPQALAKAVRHWSLANGIAADVRVDGDARPTAHDETLLRIAQEAMSNVSRHAGADRAVFTLTYCDAQVRIDIRDDGCGFDIDKPMCSAAGGTGLAGMRARVEPTGGAVEIESRAGGGCAVSVAVPG